MTVLVIDGQGGKLGRSLVEAIRKRFPTIDLIAVGTNSTASANMLRGGASRAATGENAVKTACRQADIIVGPIGIALADSLLGEISPEMANAVAQSEAERVLIPMNLCKTYVAGVTGKTAAVIEDAVNRIAQLIDREEKR